MTALAQLPCKRQTSAQRNVYLEPFSMSFKRSVGSSLTTIIQKLKMEPAVDDKSFLGWQMWPADPE